MRTQLSSKLRKFRNQYDQYIEVAQDIAHDLAVSAKKAARREKIRNGPLKEAIQRTPKPSRPLVAPAITNPTMRREQASSILICFRCQRPGHMAKDCTSSEQKAVETLSDDEQPDTSGSQNEGSLHNGDYPDSSDSEKASL
jgi:hypothetical protein